MNTIQIDRVVSRHVKYFQGGYPIDPFPSSLLKSSIIVINLDKHYMSASYWVTVCFSKTGYDSYCLLSYKHESMAYLQLHSMSWTFNRYRLYGLTTNGCDLYCCIYALRRAQGLSMTSFLEMFTLSVIQRQCKCSAISSDIVPHETGWSSSSRASPTYK
jgi:hypothetical protein